MASGGTQLAKRVAVGVAAVYPVLVLVALSINAWWKAHLGLALTPGEVLECIYGPAITLASGLLLGAGIWGLQQAVTRRTRRRTRPGPQ